jgi:periplasmic protein CpxP/Spy
MDKRLKIGVTSVVAFILLTGFGPGDGSAQGCGRQARSEEQPAGNQAERMSARFDQVMEELQVTAEQRQALEAVKEQLVADLEARQAEERSTREQLIAGLLSDAPNKEEAYAILDSKLESAKTFGHRVIDAAVEVNGILTAEQRGKLRDRITELMERQHP